MRAVSVVLLLFLLRQDRGRCEHGTRGASRPIDLARIEREYAEFGRVASHWAGRLDPRLALDEPFDSGLPACRVRRIRREKRQTPAEMVGRTLLFAPDGEGLVYVTHARRRRDLLGRLVASPDVASRFGVACAPTRITVENGELVLEERP